MVEIARYDPRSDKDELRELFEDFKKSKLYFDTEWETFEKELNERALKLQYRNSMIVAKQDGKLVGWGTFTPFKDYLGNQRILIHQIMTRKEDSFKKGIEEEIMKEIEIYIKSTLKLDKVYFICPDKDSNKRSLFMKMGMKKSDYIWYEKEI